MKDKLRVLIITIVQDKECANSNLMDFFRLHITIFFKWRNKTIDCDDLGKTFDKLIEETAFKKEMFNLCSEILH